MEGEWFKSIQEFLYKTKSKVELDKLWVPKLQRKQDQCIMDALRNCQDTPKIYRATTIADITNAEGTYINEFLFGGRISRKAENPTRSTHEWPRQPRPGPK
jgi:hypothetical protein